MESCRFLLYLFHFDLIGQLNPSHVSSLDLSTGKLTTEVFHSGNKLSGFSAGMRFAGKVVAGSFYDDGVLVCSPNNN
jgi:hypothetical protein